MPKVNFAFNETLVALRREVAPGAKWNAADKRWTMTEEEVAAFVAAARARPVAVRVTFDVEIDGKAERLGICDRNDPRIPADQRLAYDIKDGKLLAQARLEDRNVKSSRSMDTREKYYQEAMETVKSAFASASGFDELTFTSAVPDSPPAVVMVGSGLGNRRSFDVTPLVQIDSRRHGRGCQYAVKLPRVRDRHFVIAHRDGMDKKFHVAAPADAGTPAAA